VAHLNLDALRADELSPESTAPELRFVVRVHDLGLDSDGAVIDYFREHAKLICRLVQDVGVLLFRGLPATTPAEHQAMLEALGYDLYTTNYGGASPRTNLTRKTFVSTEVPPPFIIGQHTEMCYQSLRPRMISFFCAEPARRFGETPLFDCARLWAALSPKLQQKLEAHGLLYERYLYGKRSVINFRKTWQDTFGTEDRARVEAFLESEGMTYRWESNGNLATQLRLPALLVDPITGKKRLSITTFNAHAFVYMFRRFEHRYNPLVRKALERFVRWEYSKPSTFLKVLCGDGTPFSDAETDEIQAAVWDNATVFPWQRGDLLIIDNLAFGHARLNVKRPRRIVAALANEYDVRQAFPLSL
jgi:alpha-ketoglutarate-dependent taurine dioxygenase